MPNAHTSRRPSISTSFCIRVLVYVVLLCATFALAQQPDQPSTDPAASCDATVKGTEHADALADVCRFVLSLRRALPNVICDQKTSRYLRTPDMGAFGQRLRDVITAHVIYEDGRESYSDIKINGQPPSTSLNQLFGQYTKGEFGSDLIFAFRPENHPSYTFVHKDRIHSHHAFVFDVHVVRENNHGWSMQANDRRTYPEFNARLWVDQTRHDILRVEITPHPEADFPVSKALLRTDYRLISLGDGTDFVLPVKSESSSCLWDDSRHQLQFCSSNILEFQNCHKFRARSRILTDGVSTPK